MKRVGSRVAFALLLLLLTLLTTEVLVRVLKPPPRRVLFRAAIMHGFDNVDGTWVWYDAPGPPPGRSHILEDRDCVSENAFRVMVLGDSIFNGVSLPTEEVGSVLLKQRLQAAFPDVSFCVKNLAVPGYSLYQGIARARRVLPEFPPDVVLLELWGGPPRIPSRVGDTIYYFEGLAREDDGTANPMGIPSPLHRSLLTHTRTYEYLVLAWPDDCRACRYELAPHIPFLDGFLDQIEDEGGSIIPVMPAFLNHPFKNQPKGTFYAMADYETWLAGRHLTPVRLWEALEEHDSRTLSLDPVHFNAEGQSLLADVWLEHITPEVQRWQKAHQPEPTEP